MTDQDLPMTILSAEDDNDDRLLVQEAFEESGLKNRLYFVQDGISLMQYLRKQGSYAKPANAPRPDLILLDLNLPRKDGRESLAEIKADPTLRSIPVVVLTTSNTEEDVFHTYELGCAGFISKPTNFEGMLNVVKILFHYWFSVVQLVDCEHV